MKKMLLRFVILSGLTFSALTTIAQVIVQNVTYSHSPAPYTVTASGVVPPCGASTGTLTVSMLTSTLPAGTVYTIQAQSSLGYNQTNTQTTVSNNQLITQNYSGLAGSPSGVFYTIVIRTPKLPPAFNDSTYLAVINLRVVSSVDFVANVNPVQPVCPVPPNLGSASVTVLSGTAPYTYTWTATPNPGNSSSAPNLPVGSYSVYVRDANGCDTTLPFTLVVRNPVITLTGSPKPICQDIFPPNVPVTWTTALDSAWTLNPAGSYSWNGGLTWETASTKSQVVSAHGVYPRNVMFRDINGCLSPIARDTVKADRIPQVTAVAVPPSVCPGQSSDITATLVSCTALPSTSCTYSFDNGATFGASNLFTTPGIFRDTTIIVRVRNSTGCLSNPFPVNIDTLGKPKIDYVVNPDPICPNNSTNITINFTCFPANCAGYSYNFNNTGLIPAPTSVSFTSPVVAATTAFPLHVEGPSGCPLDTTVVVNVFPNLTSITAPDTTVCANNLGPFGPVTLTATGFSSITSWSPGGQTTTSITVVPTANTTYTVTGLDLNGCPRTASKQVVSLVQPNVTTPSPINHCQGTTTNLIASGATTYTWHNAGFVLQFSGNPFGVNPIVNTTYNVIGTDANGCKDTASVLVNFRTIPSGTASVFPNPICAGNTTDVTITANPPFNPNALGGYSITDGVSFSGTTPSPFVFTGVGPFATTTTLQTRLRDEYGCISLSIPVTITVTPFTFAATSTNPSCSYSTNGSISINNVTGGVAPFTYSVNGGAPVVFSPVTTIGSLPASTYIIQVVDASAPACMHDTTIVIALPPVLNIDTIVSNDVVCRGDANGTVPVTVTGGTPNYNYYLNTTGNLVLANSPSGSFTYTGLATGTYSVIVQDANGCRDTAKNIPINQPPLFANVTGPADHCAGTISTLTATGGGTYQWYNATFTTLLSPSGATFGVSPLANTTYGVIVTNGLGCKDSATFDITFRASPTGTASASPNPICAGNPADITITAGLPFTPNAAGGYSLNNGTTFTGTTASPFTFAGQGPFASTTTFQTRIRDNFGCISAAIPVTININPFTFQAVVANPSCSYSSNGSFSINSVTGGTGPFSYTVNAGAPTVFAAPVTVGSLAANTYVIEVTDGSTPTCRHDTTVTIVLPPVLNIDTTNSIDVICRGDANGSIPVTVTGGTLNYNYYLNTTGSLIFGNTASGSQTYTGLAAGTYNVIVQDANGCRDTVKNIPINQPAIALTAPFTTAPSFCFGTSTGVFTMSPAATGGWGGYAYVFNGNSIALNGTVSGLSAGTYTLSVTDSRGCQASTSVNLVSSPELFVNASTIQADCGTNGSIIFSASTGGTPGYTYSTDGVTYGGLPASLTPVNVNTTATLYVRDAQGCMRDTTVTVLNLPRAIPIISIVPPVCPDGDGMITIDSVHIKTPGGEPYSYSLFSDSNPLVQVGTGGPANANVSIDFVVGGGNYVMSMSEPLPGCQNFVVDSFRVYTSPTTYIVMTGLAAINNTYANIEVVEPAGFTVSPIALASEHDKNTGIAILYDLSGGTPFIVGGKNAYDLSIDNSTTLFTTVLKDTLSGHTYVSYSGLAPGKHLVYIRDANGCEDTLEIIIPVKIFIPNLISPNGDGYNDNFEIISLPAASELRIFNRWGDRIFLSSDYDNKYSFAGVGEGVYYYELALVSGLQFKGWVQVIK